MMRVRKNTSTVAPSVAPAALRIWVAIPEAQSLSRAASDPPAPEKTSPNRPKTPRKEPSVSVAAGPVAASLAVGDPASPAAAAASVADVP